jgi:omega-amidase
LSFILGAVPFNPENSQPEQFLQIAVSEAQSFGVEINLLVLPECTLTGFYPERVRELAESDAIHFAPLFANMALQLGASVLAGTFRKDILGFANEAILFSPLGIEISSYRKTHLFRKAQEEVHLVPGVRPTKMTISGLSVSPKICYDLRFPCNFYPEAPDVDLFAVIANWPDQRKEHWQTLLKARAIENESFVLGVNRSGQDLLGNDYTTAPLIYDPLGNPLEAVYESEYLTLWNLPDRSCYATLGSTREKFDS